MDQRVLESRLSIDVFDKNNVQLQVKVRDEYGEKRWIKLNKEDLLNIKCMFAELNLGGKDIVPEHYCKPGASKDFAAVLAKFAKYLVVNGAITVDEYEEFAINQLKRYYNSLYYNKERAALDFYTRFFITTDKKMNDMIKSYADVIAVKGIRETVKIPGEVCGFYTDDYDRVRPITSRVRYERVINIIEKLRVCFHEEMVKYKDSKVG